MNNNTFEQNKAEGYGGGVCLIGSQGTLDIDVTGDVYRSNSAQNGGGVYVSDTLTLFGTVSPSTSL